MSHLIGQVAPGCLADLVLWKPENFGARPEMVVKGGQIAWAQVRRRRPVARVIELILWQMGDANGSIPTVQPMFGRPMWACEPSAVAMNSIAWVSQAAIRNGRSPAGLYG